MLIKNKHILQIYVLFFFCFYNKFIQSNNYFDWIHNDMAPEATCSTTLWETIQFPKNLAIVPDIRIYFCGQRIKCMLDHVLKRIDFAIPNDIQANKFYVVITDGLKFIVGHNNLIKCWKIRRNKSYKFYCVELVCMNNSCSLEEPIISNPAKQNSFVWRIKELKNALNNQQVPDEAIIVCYDPHLIEGLEIGSAASLPTIKIRSYVVQIVGSEKKLHENADKLRLELINYDTFHVAAHHKEMRPAHSPKTILTLTT